MAHRPDGDTAGRSLYEGAYVREYLKKPISRISRLLPYFTLTPTDIVADFGCGSGMLLEVLHGRVAHYWGVDSSGEFIEAAARKAREMGFTNATFECGDIVEFCSRHQGCFDAAFTLDFSEHIGDDEFIRIYGAINKALKTGGRLYIHTPNGNYLVEILKKRGILRQFREHIAVRDTASYLSLLQRTDFRSISVRYLAHYVRPLSYLHFLSYVPMAGKYFRARIFMECIK